jgi:16S rRNA C1402 (ribose-2'-O) methylase RsmI
VEEPRGEIVVLVDREVLENSAADSETKTVSELVAQFESQGLDNRAALKKAARELKLSRADAYRQLVAERGRT